MNISPSNIFLNMLLTAMFHQNSLAVFAFYYFGNLGNKIKQDRRASAIINLLLVIISSHISMHGGHFVIYPLLNNQNNVIF